MGEDIDKAGKAEVAIILGASVYPGKRVSSVVNDRIESAVRLYEAGKVKKILVSGDHRERYYDEVNTIKYWLLKSHVPLSDIYMDHSGFSTGESIYRARVLFGFDNAIVVTQAFHLPRALYLARYWGISARGFSADRRIYKSARWFMAREYLARVKDFYYVHFYSPRHS